MATKEEGRSKCKTELESSKTVKQNIVVDVAEITVVMLHSYSFAYF